MLPDCTNISVQLVLTAADVLPHMLTAHRPAAIVNSPDALNTNANSFNYLSFGTINSLNAT
jgi:hypothetical protein